MAAGSARDRVPGSGVRIHVLVAALLAVLTVAAFAAAGARLVPMSVLMPMLLMLAAVQVTLQVLFYMHLRRDDRMVTLFFVSAAVLGVFIAWVVRYLLVKR